MRNRYLGSIDGLRAVSILGVVASHVGIPGVAGGYVGVDIFFVISGFLIINQIRNALEAGKFSITEFYARRALRILPPFLIMFVVVVALAPFFMTTPDVTSDFIKSAAYAPMMLSNVFFYLSQGYFDISSYEKPFLHTWTLSVEEQFYLFIPLLLVLLFRWRGARFDRVTVFIAIAAALISLVGAIARTSTDGPNEAFYLTHWRMWEFIIGGLITPQLISAAQRLSRWRIEAIGLAGLACIAVAFVAFSSTTPFPSWRAILPVTGAALVIVASQARAGTAVGKVLEARIMIGIGLVSYAWYLWHWPILSFVRQAHLGDGSFVAASLGGGVAALLLAIASYFLVERPIRRWKSSGHVGSYSTRIAAGAVAACLIAAVVGGGAAFANHQRLTSVLATTYNINGRGEFENNCRASGNLAMPPTCFTDKVALLIGDSRAAAMFGSFARNFHEAGKTLVLVGRGGCNPLYLSLSERKQHREHPCARLIAPFEELLARPKSITSVMVTPSMSTMNSVALWEGLISQFDPQTRVLIIAPPPQFPEPVLKCIVLSDRWHEARDRCSRLRSEAESERAPLVGILKQVAANHPATVRYADPFDLFCDAQMCRPFEGNRVFFSDQVHLLPGGADRIYEGLRADFDWVSAVQ